MPSPAGHVIAGLTIAWAAQAVETVRRRPKAADRPPAASGSRAVTPLVMACALLALAPDIDILFASHRTFTHSLGAVVAAALAGGAIARLRGSRELATAITCGLVVASHVVLDWLGRDSNTPRGVMAFWPVSTAYFYSGIDLFAEVSRRYWKPDEFILQNALSVARELLILGPVAGAAFWICRRRLEHVGQRQFSSGVSEPRLPAD
jgi:hypothetical protein